MSSVPPTSISVAEVKRRFADVLGDVRYRGERYIVERNGTPMAALVPLADLSGGAAHEGASGFLALVGAFDDASDYADVLDEVVRSRRTQRPRPAPPLGES